MIPLEDKNLDQIEYLLDQSSQGLHFLFEKQQIINALKKSEQEGLEFFTFENKNKVQGLLLKIIERESFSEKQIFIESLKPEEHELVIQAYFHLVDSTILTRSKLKH